jgi:hypothetical protein
MTTKGEWCAPTRVLSQSRLLKLLDRSTKLTESLEVEMIVGDRPTTAIPITVEDPAPKPAPRPSHDRIAMTPLSRLREAVYPTHRDTLWLARVLVWLLMIAAIVASLAMFALM